MTSRHTQIAQGAQVDDGVMTTGRRTIAHRLLEAGVELNDVLHDRIEVFRADHERAKAALEGARVQASDSVAIDPAKITASSKFMTSVLESAENPARKPWLRSLISKVEVDIDRIRFIGSKDVLNTAVATAANSDENVQNCVPKWRAVPGEDDSYVYAIAL